MKQKNIKVVYSSRCQSRSCWGGSTYTNYPKIQMEGKWLEALGYHVGDHVLVSVQENRLIIEPAPVPEAVPAK